MLPRAGGKTDNWRVRRSLAVVRRIRLPSSHLPRAVSRNPVHPDQDVSPPRTGDTASDNQRAQLRIEADSRMLGLRRGRTGRNALAASRTTSPPPPRSPPPASSPSRLSERGVCRGPCRAPHNVRGNHRGNRTCVVRVSANARQRCLGWCSSRTPQAARAIVKLRPRYLQTKNPLVVPPKPLVLWTRINRPLRTYALRSLRVPARAGATPLAASAGESPGRSVAGSCPSACRNRCIHTYIHIHTYIYMLPALRGGYLHRRRAPTCRPCASYVLHCMLSTATSCIDVLRLCSPYGASILSSPPEQCPFLRRRQGKQAAAF